MLHDPPASPSPLPLQCVPTHRRIVLVEDLALAHLDVLSLIRRRGGDARVRRDQGVLLCLPAVLKLQDPWIESHAAARTFGVLEPWFLNES